MALRSVATRTISRRLSTAVESSSKGPRIPVGNDPAAFHPREHAVNDSGRWKMISLLFGVPVAGFGVLKLSKPHEHVEAPPQYPYMRMATRSPRFPWGDNDLIGASYEKHGDHGEH